MSITKVKATILKMVNSELISCKVPIRLKADRLSSLSLSGNESYDQIEKICDSLFTEVTDTFLSQR